MKKTVVALALVIIGFYAGAEAPISQEAVKSDNLLPFMDEAEYWGFMDRTGKVVIPADYDAARPFSEGIALVWDKGYPAYIDRTGNEIWDPPDILDLNEDDLIELEIRLGNFQEGLACVMEKGRFGFIDKTGKYAIKPQFLSAGGFSEGLAPAKTQEGYGYIRQDGTFAVKPQFDSAGFFSGGLAPVLLGEKWGYIDKTGKVAIKMQFDKAGGFSEGLASFGIRNPGEKKGIGFLADLREDYNFPGKYGYIDGSGKAIINAQFEATGYFSEGLAAVRKGKLWGYIDRTGSLLVDPQFDGVSPFSEGLAAVNKGGKWGYIDKTGRMPINPQFDVAGDFVDGLAMVWLGKKMGYILPTGKFFWGPSK